VRLRTTPWARAVRLRGMNASWSRGQTNALRASPRLHSTLDQSDAFVNNVYHAWLWSLACLWLEPRSQGPPERSGRGLGLVFLVRRGWGGAGGRGAGRGFKGGTLTTATSLSSKSGGGPSTIEPCVLCESSSASSRESRVKEYLPAPPTLLGMPFGSNALHSSYRFHRAATAVGVGKRDLNLYLVGIPTPPFEPVATERELSVLLKIDR
jgi:hypothetical protein